MACENASQLIGTGDKHNLNVVFKNKSYVT